MCQFSSFSAVRIYRWLHFLKLCGYTAVQQNFLRERGTPAATGGGIPQWRHAWGHVEAPRVWVWGRGYAIALQELIT